MHNHINLVHTLSSKINNAFPNVAKQLRSYGGYQTAMIGKWHLGEGKAHEPTGFDHWDVLEGQGEYFDPTFINEKGSYVAEGYTTDVITDKAVSWLDTRDRNRPFFLMCHHKAPHSPFAYHPRYEGYYKDPIKVPETYEDDYKNRAAAAAAATNKIAVDMTYNNLGLVQPEGGSEVGRLRPWGAAPTGTPSDRKVPYEVAKLPEVLIDRRTGERYRFKTDHELRQWKYQQYMRRYLRTVQRVPPPPHDISLELISLPGQSTMASGESWTSWVKVAWWQTRWSSTPRIRVSSWGGLVLHT